jgi:ATP-binding cassette subfamily F protein 3
MEIQEFDGRYIDYNFSLLESKIELQELAQADTEEIKRNEALIEKFRFAAEINSNSSIGRGATARLKINERLEARRIKTPFVYIRQPKIELVVENEIQETTALKVNDYSVAFDDVILENVNFEIGSTDKVVLIGPNGTGKTTLLREIYKNNHKSIEFDKDIEVAYLSQLQSEILDDSNTILEEFFESGFKTSDEIISCLLDYGFSETIINQKIGSLSGGERNILQIAKISNSKANMLLLDEPTSHLDTYSQIALEKAIGDYKGAILMISHDFYTIVNSMDYVLIIENKTIRKMSMKKFRKMIYNTHFSKDYLDIEQKKQLVETKIATALQDNDFILAKSLCEELESLIELL